METYNASEGFFGLQDDPTDPSLLMMPDYGIFYEFIPMNEVGSAHPTVLPLESVETGKNYAMVIRPREDYGAIRSEIRYVSPRYSLINSLSPDVPSTLSTPSARS